MTVDETIRPDKISGKKVLVTGAGGSIGSELCRKIGALNPSVLAMADIDETELYMLGEELAWLHPKTRTKLHLADIRDPERMDALMSDESPDMLLHAAAYKHVPMLEEHAAEAVAANVQGTLNVAMAAGRGRVATFVNLSTDKAVRPTSIMGLTKRVAELVIRRCAEIFPETSWASVRFGNVAGSRGSVIPLFARQIARGGPVTVTHPDATRYFITTGAAAELVLAAAALGGRGCIYMLDMGEPVRITDLALEMISASDGKDIEIVFSGLRPGERLAEEPLIRSTPCSPTGIDLLYVTTPDPVDATSFDSRMRSLLELPASTDAAGFRCILDAMTSGERVP